MRTRHPYEERVLKALGEVGIAGVPRDIPRLQTETDAGSMGCTKEGQASVWRSKPQYDGV